MSKFIIIFSIIIIIVFFVFKFIKAGGWKHTVDTQIHTYKKLKKNYPESSISELIYMLVETRFGSIPSDLRFSMSIISGLTKENEILSKVVYSIIEYEYISERRIDTSDPKVLEFLNNVEKYINDKINKIVN